MAGRKGKNKLFHRLGGISRFLLERLRHERRCCYVDHRGRKGDRVSTCDAVNIIQQTRTISQTTKKKKGSDIKVWP